MQVLVSIQSIILIEEPFFNEPGYESEQGTPAGTVRSQAYNERLCLGTVRHAMLDMLRSPPEGMEELVQAHFRALGGRIMQECSQWVQSASSADLRAELGEAVAQLQAELLKLGALTPVEGQDTATLPVPQVAAAPAAIAVNSGVASFNPWAAAGQQSDHDDEELDEEDLYS